MTASLEKQSPESLLVVRLGAMGDIIHTLPAVAELRQMFPDTRVGWVVEERWAELLCANGTARSGPRSAARPLVDAVHLVNTKRWRKSLLSTETRRQIRTSLHEVREEKYEIAIDFQGAIKSAVIARASGAKRIYGMEQPRESPARMSYHKSLPMAGTHVIEQYRSLAESVAREFRRDAPAGQIGDRTSKAALLPCDPEAERSVTTRLSETLSKFAIINPGAGWGAKQWPAERYGIVAKKLAGIGVKPVVNFGPGEEELAERVVSASEGTAEPLSWSIGELIALSRRSRLFVGGDTGPLHLAAALRVPVVAIFGPTDPARNGPYGTESIVLRNPESRTSLSHVDAPEQGLLQISAEEVFAACTKLLGEQDA